MTELDVAMASASRPAAKKRGRKPAQFWVSFTALDEPYKSRAAPCRHCAATVNYHKKWEQAKSHLLKCEPFLKLMRETDAHARPEWFEIEVEKRRRSAVRLLPIDSVVHGVDASEVSGPSLRTVARKPSSRPKKRNSLSGFDGVANGELLLLEAVRSGHAVDQELLKHVLAREQDGGARTIGDVVDKLHQRVSRCVNDALRTQSGAAALLVVYCNEPAKAVDFGIIKDDRCFFVDQVTVPESVCDNENAVAAWLVEEIRRVGRNQSFQPQRWVVNAPSELVNTVASLITQGTNELNVTRIRNSRLRVFSEMVEELLSCFIESGDDDNPLDGLLEVAWTCYDVLSLLEIRTPSPEYVSRGFRTKQCTVQGLRSMSHGDVLWSIIDGEKLLDSDVLQSMVERVRLEKTTIETLRSSIEDSGFIAKLRRFYSILQPLHSLLTLFEKRVIYPSDVFVAFASIERSYMNNQLISTEQRQFLVQKVAKYEPVVVQDEDLLTHLLDPAYVGELLGDAAKAKAEHRLMAMAKEDDVSDKQALYVEYTQFQVAAVQQQVSDDGFVRRMLKERKKTMLQYWLTDGRRWPRLQAIALALEQVPADAVLSWKGHEDRVLPTDPSIKTKVVYLQRNGPLLAVRELMDAKAVIVDSSSNIDSEPLGGHVVL